MHARSHAGEPPLTPSHFFRVGVYTVLKPSSALLSPSAPSELLGFRAILYALESASPQPRLKVLAKSMTTHGTTIKSALNGLLEVTAGMVWHHYNEALMELELGEDGFLGRSRSTSALRRSVSPASSFAPQRQPTPRASPGIGHQGRDEYFQAIR